MLRKLTAAALIGAVTIEAKRLSGVPSPDRSERAVVATSAALFYSMPNQRALSVGPSKTWIKVKDPKAPAATRAADGTF